MDNTTKTFVGIDVSQAKLDVYVIPTNDYKQFGNTTAGIKKLIAWLKKLEPETVIFESTGNDEQSLMFELGEADIPHRQINPLWIRHYIQSCGQLAKNDRIDAKMLAQYAAERQPKSRKKLTQRDIKLRGLMTWHQQMTDQLAKLKIQHRKATLKRVKAGITAQMQMLEQQMAELAKEIDAFLMEEIWQQELREILISMPGVSHKTARLYAIRLPEIGSLSSAQIAALVGVAPMCRESGRWWGNRYIRGGRADVRKGTYNAIGSSVTRGYNPVLHAFYKRLRAAGKSHKCAMTACVRKTVVILNAMVRNRTKWMEFKSQAEAMCAVGEVAAR